MGAYEHHWRCWKFRLREDVSRNRNREISKSALGHHPLNGTVPFAQHWLAQSLIFWQDSFYKSLTPEQNALAHANEYDLDSPGAIDFDLLVQKLQELKQGYFMSGSGGFDRC